MHVQERMQDGGWEPDLERWGSDEDSEDSEVEHDGDEAAGAAFDCVERGSHKPWTSITELDHTAGYEPNELTGFQIIQNHQSKVQISGSETQMARSYDPSKLR